jgi:hypothetical protein
MGTPYGPARRSTVLAIKTPIFPHCPNAPIVRMMKPAVNRRADQGRRPVTFPDLYLLGNLVNLRVRNG